VTFIFFKGPLSTSNCIENSWIIGQNNVDNYNIISIDQVRHDQNENIMRDNPSIVANPAFAINPLTKRGMGRSWPSTTRLW